MIHDELNNNIHSYYKINNEHFTASITGIRKLSSILEKKKKKKEINSNNTSTLDYIKTHTLPVKIKVNTY